MYILHSSLAKSNRNLNVTYEVFTVMKMEVTVLWIPTLYPITALHGITTHKTMTLQKSKCL